MIAHILRQDFERRAREVRGDPDQEPLLRSAAPIAKAEPTKAALNNAYYHDLDGGQEPLLPLPPVSACSAGYREVMLACLRVNKIHRPTFEDVVVGLEALLAMENAQQRRTDEEVTANAWNLRDVSGGSSHRSGGSDDAVV